MSDLFDQQFCTSLGCGVAAFSLLLASFMVGKCQRPALPAPAPALVASAAVSSSLLPEDQYHSKYPVIRESIGITV